MPQIRRHSDRRQTKEPKKVIWTSMMNLIDQALGGNCN